MHAEKDAVLIDRDHGHILLFSDVRRGGHGAEDTGIVDQHVGRTEFFLRRLDDAIPVRAVGNIMSNKDSIGTEVGGERLALRFAHVGQDDARAFVDEQLGM